MEEQLIQIATGTALPWTIACIAVFAAWRFHRWGAEAHSVCHGLRDFTDKMTDLARRYAHDRLHFAFVATVLSQCVKTEGLSMSVKTNPNLMALNAVFTDGAVMSCGDIAKHRNILPGIKLDLDANEAVVGIEVIGNCRSDEGEEGEEWKGGGDWGDDL